MNHAKHRAQARNKLINELADRFESSGVEYTCGAVIIDWVKENVTTQQLEAIPGNWTAGRCAQRVWDEVHKRWQNKNAPDQTGAFYVDGADD